MREVKWIYSVNKISSAKEVVEEHPEESVEEVQEKRHTLGSGTLPTSQEKHHDS